MSTKDLTIIITSFKSNSKISSCLDSIDRTVKVILIENSCNKKFKEFIEKKYQNVKCIIPDKNLGYAKANNIGLRQTTTKYALILNPDTSLSADTLKNFFETASKYKDFSLIGPNSEEQKSVITKNNITEVENIKGFAIFFNMNKFSEQKYFDENYFLYFEDIDLCRQVKKNNGKIYIDEKIKVYHQGGKSVDNDHKEEIEKNRNWHWMWSTFYYHNKYNNFLYALILVLPKLFSSILKIFFHTLYFNKDKRDIYSCRLSGLFNSILGRKSWRRPSLD